MAHISLFLMHLSPGKVELVFLYWGHHTQRGCWEYMVKGLLPLGSSHTFISAEYKRQWPSHPKVQWAWYCESWYPSWRTCLQVLAFRKFLLYFSFSPHVCSPAAGLQMTLRDILRLRIVSTLRSELAVVFTWNHLIWLICDFF